MNDQSQDGNSGERSRSVRWVACLLVLGLAVGLAAFATIRLRDVRTALVVTTTPPDAKVYLSDAYVGRTPLAYGQTAAGTYQMRVAKDGYKSRDRRLVLRDPRTVWQRLLGREPEPVRVAVTLEPHGFGSLKVVSEPLGARVYVDGEFAGITPVTVPRLRAGRRSVRLQLADHEHWQGDVVQKPDAQSEIRQALVSRVERYYLDRLAKEPKHVAHYVGLAHHYVVRGRFGDAAKLLKKCYAMLQKAPLPGAGRFYWELCKIATRQFGYPPDTGKVRISVVCRNLLDDAHKKHPGDRTITAWWKRMHRALK